MKIINSEKRLCACCMEDHDVKTVLVDEQTTFKNVRVDYEAFYLYCDKAEALYMDERQVQENDARMKDAYRKKTGILTSIEISGIRTKYDISQGDMCTLLGWGGKTITRYESHQVQDKAHDTILKKIDQDPEWYLSLLCDVKVSIPSESYKRYIQKATALYEAKQDTYLRKTIMASYAKYRENQILHGNTKLSLDKVVDVIRYFAASDRVRKLYKGKLMKLMWYADALSFKNRGQTITGMIYKVSPLGAVPIGHDIIIHLNGVPCKEIDLGEASTYDFSLSGENEFPFLSDSEKDILDIVIEKLGKRNKNEIAIFMNEERILADLELENAIPFSLLEHIQL